MHYDPHAEPDISGEAAVMSRGRLVKARLPDQEPPNVDWFWVPTGNCHACHYFGGDVCRNPRISSDEFLNKYVHLNTCPEYELGSEDADLLDVMKAAGLVGGDPVQRVGVIVDSPWTVHLALRAHREESTFLRMAAQADSGADNEPDRGEYVDLAGDLEPAPAAPQVP